MVAVIAGVDVGSVGRITDAGAGSVTSVAAVGIGGEGAGVDDEAGGVVENAVAVELDFADASTVSNVDVFALAWPQLNSMDSAKHSKRDEAKGRDEVECLQNVPSERCRFETDRAEKERKEKRTRERNGKRGRNCLL